MTHDPRRIDVLKNTLEILGLRYEEQKELMGYTLELIQAVREYFKAKDDANRIADEDVYAEEQLMKRIREELIPKLRALVPDKEEG